MLRGGGEEQGMTRLRLAPRSLWGPLGPPKSPPTAPDSFYSLSSPSRCLFLLFISLPHNLFSISSFPLVFRIPLSKRLSACFSTTKEGPLIHF